MPYDDRRCENEGVAPVGLSTIDVSPCRSDPSCNTGRNKPRARRLVDQHGAHCPSNRLAQRKREGHLPVIHGSQDGEVGHRIEANHSGGHLCTFDSHHRCRDASHHVGTGRHQATSNHKA